LVTASLLIYGEILETSPDRTAPMTEITTFTPQSPKSVLKQNESALWAVAQDLEATFLEEMLKSISFGEPSEDFGGGIGEEQFGSFLRQAQAKEMVRSGGIGLAEAVFNSLKERSNEAS
jgi:Rod binding domain-containing protein